MNTTNTFQHDTQRYGFPENRLTSLEVIVASTNTLGFLFRLFRYVKPV